MTYTEPLSTLSHLMSSCSVAHVRMTSKGDRRQSARIKFCYMFAQQQGQRNPSEALCNAPCGTAYRSIRLLPAALGPAFSASLCWAEEALSRMCGWLRGSGACVKLTSQASLPAVCLGKDELMRRGCSASAALPARGEKAGAFLRPGRLVSRSKDDEDALAAASDSWRCGPSRLSLQHACS